MGLSFGKVILLAVVVVAVIYGYKLLQRRQAVRDARARNDEVKRAHAAAAARPRPQAEPEEMVACKQCGDYVPRRLARSCGRPGCPFG